MNSRDFNKAFVSISKNMTENRNYLIELDQKNGDGDLGISMDNGFRSIVNILMMQNEEDLGKVLILASSAMNDSAPSTLGTIISFGLIGMAKKLMGKTEIDLQQFSEAFENGVNNIMKKASSKPGEKTILDGLFPALEELKTSHNNSYDAFKTALEKSIIGVEATKNMRSVHGRAAYYRDKSVGLIDGGAVVGMLIFKGIFESCQGNSI